MPIEPDPVIVPPVSGDDAVMLVTVPLPLLLNVVQSVLLRYPSTTPVACGMLIFGALPGVALRCSYSSYCAYW